MGTGLVFSSGQRPRPQGCRCTSRRDCASAWLQVPTAAAAAPAMPRPSSKVETSLTFLVTMSTQIPTKTGIARHHMCFDVVEQENGIMLMVQ